jgi:hypothetical protein
MKGVIVLCLESLVKENFGEEKWVEVAKQTGFDPETRFLASQDIDDQIVLKTIGSLCSVLNISMPQAADAFGDYWINKYAPKMYGVYYARAANAKEFLLKMDNVHEVTTKNVANARPPRFDYEWKDEKTLVMTYKSQRDLIGIFVGLVKGIGKYYKENLKVTQKGNDKVEIVFE